MVGYLIELDCTMCGRILKLGEPVHRRGFGGKMLPVCGRCIKLPADHRVGKIEQLEFSFETR